LDRRLAARATLALALAGVRYRRTVAPVVAVQLAHWHRRALAIPDPRLRALALEKLRDERFNAEAGAMLATLAPRPHRADAVRAIIALQVLFDLLDGLTEQPLRDPLPEGERLFAAFTDAMGASSQRSSASGGDDGGYLQELSSATSSALSRLPARGSVLEVAAASARRAAQAQIRMHAAPALGIDQLRDWAQAQAPGTGLQWRELAAGAASSVLVLHALIAAAANVETTPAQAAGIEHAYLSICVLLTLLDGLVDETKDERAGERGYVALFEDRELLARTLAEAAARASGRARCLRGGAHHMMMLTGVVAYYTSAADARDERVRPLVVRLHRDLAPLIAPSLAFMRAWRLARRLRAPLG
jgi:tetraprenyl-beta-curcumene synthase